MSLIKCPECGKEVSTFADACPHCGFPLNKTSNNQSDAENNYPEPKDTSWTLKWFKKSKKVKMIWLFSFIVSALIFTCFLIITILARNSFGGIGSPFFILTFIFGLVSGIVLVLLFYVVASFRIKTREFDGYTILVYIGSNCYLVIEDEIKDKEERFMHGELPNGKPVSASISVIDGSVNICVGQEDNGQKIIL